MNKLRLILVGGIIAVVLLTTFGLKSSTTPKPEVGTGLGFVIGSAAPDFTLQDLSGNTVRLRDLKGKAVYINFWATWCPPCKEEIPELEKFYRKNKDKVVMLAINITFNDKLNDIQKTLKENNITYPILLDYDESKGAAALFGITGVPEHFFIDKNGVLKAKGIGPMNLEMLQRNLAKAL